MPRGKKKQPVAETTFVSTLRALFAAGGTTFDNAGFFSQNPGELLQLASASGRDGKITLPTVIHHLPVMAGLTGNEGIAAAMSVFRFLENQASQWGVPIDYSSDTDSTDQHPPSTDTDATPATNTKRRGGRPKKSATTGDQTDGRRKGSIASRIIEATGKGDKQLALEVLSEVKSDPDVGSIQELARAVKTKYGIAVTPGNLTYIMRALREAIEKPKRGR